MLVRLIGEDIELQTILGREPGAVKVDPGQFEQILVNLVVNARDAMREGGRLVIETSIAEPDDGYGARHPGASPGRYLLLSVSDTGHGMTEEVKAHLFEPFFTTKPMGTGTRLGLAMVYGAVQQAGGFIEVLSEVGGGTAFRIFLPRADEKASRRPVEDRSAELRGGPETVLVVEDEAMVRDLCVEVLKQFGYKVLNKPNGAEALALAREHGERIDLLLTDVVMPEMNGRVLSEQLAALHPETKVLFTSGYMEDVIVHHGVVEKGVSFLAKPYTPAELLKKVREVLDRAR
jgi:CheY-like chemotaxis protein